MNRLHPYPVYIGMAILVSASGCETPESTTPGSADDTLAAKPVVVATTWVLEDIVRRLGADEFEVFRPEQHADNSGNFDPLPEAIQRMQSADLLLTNGAGYESWLTTVTLPRSRIINTSNEFQDRLMTLSGSPEHQHGPNGPAAMGSTAWATWLDPKLAIAQVKSVQSRLERLANRTNSVGLNETSGALYRSYVEELQTIDDRLNQLQDRARQQTVLCDTPQMCYLIRRLGWTMKTVTISDTAAGSDAWRTAIDEVSPNLILCTWPISKVVTDAVADRDIPFAEVDLCVETREKQSFPERLARNLDQIEAALSQF